MLWSKIVKALLFMVKENSCEQLAHFITILIAGSYNNLCELPL